MSAPQAVAAWLAGEAAPDLDQLAAYILAPDAELTPDEIEERITLDLDTAIFEAEHDLAHGQADRATRARLATMQAKRDQLIDAWHAAIGAADYRADKLIELDAAPDAVAAADAVARWNLFEPQPRLPAVLPPAEPSAPLPRASKAELHAAVLAHVAGFFSRADRPVGEAETATPPRVLLTAETGSAKTGIALAHLRTMIEHRKRAGLPCRAILAVPAHRLGREIEARATAAGINAALFLGRGDPNKPDQPCKNLEAVGLARQAGADIRSAVCGPAPGGGRCGFRDSCEYFAGLARAEAADLVIVAHNFLFEQLPASLKPGLAWLVVDEDFAALSDRNFGLTADTLAPESLARGPVLADDDTADPGATAELQRLHDMVREAARTCIDGYLTADALRSAGFTAMSDAPARMRTLTWRRQRSVQMRPGMDLEARRAAARLAAVNGQLPGIAALTHALDAILTGGTAAAGLVSVRLDMRRSGSSTVLQVRGQRESAAWLAELPGLMLNATGRIEDVRRVFPDAELAETPRAAWPHCEVHQIIGGFGRSTLARHKTRLAEMRDFIAVATLGQESALVVTHKNCEDAFAGMPGIATAHHGDIAGSDQHARVDSAFVIGGAFARPEIIASIAAARGGGAVAVAKPERVTRAALLTTCAAVAVECMAYADPAADAVHRGIYDASIVQAIGRVRPLERTTSNPAVSWVFSNVALPFPVASVARWQDARPDRLVRMVAHGAVWLNPEDAHQFEPDMFRSAKAAEHVRGRVDDAREGVRSIVRADLLPWVRVLYQLPGQGMHLREVLIRAGAEAATRAVIEGEHGELKQWIVRPLTPGREVLPILGKSITYGADGSTSSELPAIVPAWLAGASKSRQIEARGPPDG